MSTVLSTPLSTALLGATLREPSLLRPGERLIHGIWPRRLAIWMAVLYLALFIIRPWEVLVPALGAVHFERIYAICMIAAVLLSGRLSLRSALPQTAAVLAVLLAMAASALFAVDPTVAWQPLYIFATLVVFYFVLLLVVQTPYELVFVVTCYLVAMGVYMAKAQWEFFLNGRHDYKMGVTRLVGIEETFGGPNAVALSVVLSFPFLYFLFLHRKTIGATWPYFWRKAFPVCLGLYLFLAITTVVLTRSRSGVVSAVLFVGLLVLRSKGMGKKLLAFVGGVVLLVVLWFAMSDEARNRIRTIWDPNAGPANATESAYGRVAGFLAGLHMFQDHPLTGIGIGNFVPYRVAFGDGVALEAHNFVGQLLGETGLVGVIAFAFMVGVTLWNCRRIRRLTRGMMGPLPALRTNFAAACQDVIILLLFEGLAAHNMDRFNWLWVAAFAALALRFASEAAAQLRGRYAAAVTTLRDRLPAPAPATPRATPVTPS
jgi:O-antigen ligase